MPQELTIGQSVQQAFHALGQDLGLAERDVQRGTKRALNAAADLVGYGVDIFATTATDLFGENGAAASHMVANAVHQGANAVQGTVNSGFNVANQGMAQSQQNLDDFGTFAGRTVDETVMLGKWLIVGAIAVAIIVLDKK